MGANVMFCDINAEKIGEVEVEGIAYRWCKRYGSQRG